MKSANSLNLCKIRYTAVKCVKEFYFEITLSDIFLSKQRFFKKSASESVCYFREFVHEIILFDT